MVGGVQPLLPETQAFKNVDFQSTSVRSASAVRPGEKVQLSLIATRFPMSLRWTA